MEKTKRKSFLMIFALILILPFAFILTACGGDRGDTNSKVTGFEFDNQFIYVPYGEQISQDPFGTKVLFSDGTKKSVNELTAEEVETLGISVALTKFNPDTNQDEEWSFTNRMTVGSYNLKYICGDITSIANITIDKANYTGSVSVSMSANNMQYGQALAKPTLNFSIDTVTEITYYYQSATDDGSYHEDFDGEYYAYDWEEGAICDITPGNYQLYALVTTENYNTFRTGLRNFVVQKATVTTNYKLFKYAPVWHPDPETDGGSYVWEYLPLESAYEVTYYDNQSEKLSDYIKNLSFVYIFEVDEQGNIMLDGEEQQVRGYSIQECYANEYRPLTLSSEDVSITKPGNYYVSMRFSPDASLYRPIPLNITLKVNKIRVNLYDINLGIEYHNDIYANIYDGKEYQIKVNCISNVKKIDGQYYGCAVYIDATETEVFKPLYRITNYAQTNAGTYNVVLSVVDDMRNCVEFVWTEDDTTHTSLTSVNLGSWAIDKKTYDMEADIMLNGNAIEEFYDQGLIVLSKGQEYTLSAQNIVAKFNNIADEDVIPSIGNIRIVTLNDEQNGYVDLSNEDVTIDNGTHSFTISNDCQYEDIYLVIDFEQSNPNYAFNSICENARL